MKKEYTEIFWGLYAIKKDAEKLQEQFMPEKDRTLLKNFIDGCWYYNLQIVFWPDSFWRATQFNRYNDVFFKTQFNQSI